MSLVELKWGSPKSHSGTSIVGRSVPLIIVGHTKDEFGNRNEIEFGSIRVFFSFGGGKSVPNFELTRYIPTLRKGSANSILGAERVITNEAVDFLKILGVKCVMPANGCGLGQYQKQ